MKWRQRGPIGTEGGTPEILKWQPGEAPSEGPLPQHLLTLVEAGEGPRVSIAGHDRTVPVANGRGEVCFLPSGLHWRMERPLAGAAASMAVAIPPDALVLATGLELHPRPAVREHHPRIEEAMRWLSRRRDVGGHRPKLVELLLARLVAAAFCGMPRRPDDAWLAPATLQRIDDLARSRDRGIPTLSTLSREAGLSASAFSRGFRGSVGMTPGEFLIGVRMDLVADLLASTDLPLPEIARAVGMASVAHANQQFRRRHGVSLARYRASRGAEHGASRPDGAALEPSRDLAKTAADGATGEPRARTIAGEQGKRRTPRAIGGDRHEGDRDIG